MAKIALRVLLLVGVGWLVWHELRHIDFRTARHRIQDADTSDLLVALLAAACAIGVMGLYDVLAFPSTPKLPPLRRWGLGMLFFSWTNFLTLGPIGGPALRLYFYRKAGLETGEIVRGLARLYAGMFGGLTAWTIAAVAPIGSGPGMLAARVAIAFGLAPAIAVVAGRVAQRVRPVGDFTPRAGYLARLGLIGAVDWAAALVAFVLAGQALGIKTASGEALQLTDQIRTVFVGHFVGLVSMMPGGLGSADAIWLKMLTAQGVTSSAAAAHIVLFRLVFYLAPWAISLLGLYVNFAGKTQRLMRWQRRVLAGALAINAVLLLASTATPAMRYRFKMVQDFVPLDAMEASHAVAVVAAAVMLFLIRGILRGYRAAFIVTGTMLAVSAVAHTLKGGDFEEALVSVGMLLMLVGARRAFTRRGRIPVGWELTIAAALGSVLFFVLVGMTAFQRHPHLSPTMWDRIRHAPAIERYWRDIALLGAVGVIFFLRQAVVPRRAAASAGEAEIGRALREIQRRAPRAATLTVGCGDKGVWFWKSGVGMVDAGEKEVDGLAVYQHRGSKLVIFSDPVVDHQLADEFLDDLHAFATDHDLNLVFYQLTGDWMPHLHDFGYTFFKLGEEAVVPLAGFSLEGGAGHGYRKTIRRVEGEGVSFEVLRPPLDAGLIDELRGVSDAWLAHKGIQEMQFSLGYFSPAYLQRFPVAVVRDREGRVAAFMNLLGTRPEEEPAGRRKKGKRPAASAGGEAAGARGPVGELTSDLMRYVPGIDQLMDYMVLKMMVWAGAEGYAALNLGMCPLFDVGESRKASLPERLARLLFEHGERIYNYRGLHAFKDKFRPVWEPRFMAYQRPWDWPSAVWATTSLIWGRSGRDRRRIEGARGEAGAALPAAPSAAAGAS